MIAPHHIIRVLIDSLRLLSDFVKEDWGGKNGENAGTATPIAVYLIISLR
jgi:hypothetical protein